MRGVLAIGTGPNRLLRAGLIAIAGVFIARALVTHLLADYPFGVDLEIPLRAADRWIHGGQPYLASAFESPPGPTQPFLYPPYVLPFVAVLLAIPQPVVKGAWLLILAACAIYTCERLGVRRRWWAGLIAWPPFSEGLIGGNVQLAVFALFVACLWRASGVDQDLTAREGRWSRSLDAIGVGAIKVSQPHLWVFVLRFQPRVTIIVGLGVAATALALLPATGLDVWRDWADQLQRASNPSWELGGIAIARFSPLLGLLVFLACLAVVPFLRPRGNGATLGVLSTVGALSLHPFGLLFLIPAMLRTRLELTMIATTLIATYTYEGTWTAILLIAVVWFASFRWPQLRETPGADDLLGMRARGVGDP